MIRCTKCFTTVWRVAWRGGSAPKYARREGIFGWMQLRERLPDGVEESPARPIRSEADIAYLGAHIIRALLLGVYVQSLTGALHAHLRFK